MSFAYLALEPADEEYNTPCSWPDGWTFPSTSAGPWPPGWPVSAENLAGEDDADYSIALTVDAWLYAGGPATVTVRTLLNGADTDDFDCQLIKVEADIGGTVVQVKKNADDSFANQVYFRVENYSGSNYGFSESVILNLDSGDNGSTVTITATLCSTDPEYTDEGDLGSVNPEVLALGSNGGVVADAYSDGLDSWRSLPSFPSSSIITAPGAATVSSVGYVYGGLVTGTVETQETIAFNPATEAYELVAHMPTPPRSRSGSCPISSRAYSFGGLEDDSSTEYADNDEFTPATETWANETDMATAARYGMAACQISSKGYIFGGVSLGPTAYYDLTDEYEPVGNTWTAKTTLSSTRGFPGASTIGSYGYVYGGANGGGYQQTHERYDASGNSFSAMTNMPAPARHGVGACAANSKAIASGGFDGSTYADLDVYDPSGNAWTAGTDRSVASKYNAGLAA